MRLSLTSVPLWMALVPLALYLMALGGVHLRRRPLAISGQVDAGLLALAVAGLVIAGPLAVMEPVAGASVWASVALVVGFVLVVAFAMLAARPRLIVYNIGLDQLRPLVVEVVAALDDSARWAGETAALPARGFQFHLDARGAGRTVSIVAAGDRPPAEAWSEFSRRLRRAVRRQRVRSSPWGIAFAASGACVAAMAAWMAMAAA